MAQKDRRLVAAKAIICNKDGSILLLRQSVEEGVSNGGRYQLPGGILEPGETLREALLREVQEEAGLTAHVGEVFDVGEWEADIRGTHYWFVGVFFVCTTHDETVTLDVAESMDYTWINKNDVDTYDIVEPAKSIIKKYLAGA